MNRFVMADPQWCTGCKTCLAACSDVHKKQGLQQHPRLAWFAHLSKLRLFSAITVRMRPVSRSARLTQFPGMTTQSSSMKRSALAANSVHWYVRLAR